jgi:preprotein translocase subunit SecE
VARNRQRAKERQAARRAERERQRQQGGGDGADRDRDREKSPPQERGGDIDPILGGTPGVVRDDDVDQDELLRQADLAAGAPPHDLGFSDETLQHSPLKEGDEEDLEELDEELEDYDFEDEEQPLEPETAGPRGVRGGRAGAEERHRNRLIAFLIAVWAELRRVQWPNRRQTTQMTGVVLIFVLIAGGYLGLLDAIFSRLIQQII